MRVWRNLAHIPLLLGLSSLRLTVRCVGNWACPASDQTVLSLRFFSGKGSPEICSSSLLKGRRIFDGYLDRKGGQPPCQADCKHFEKFQPFLPLLTPLLPRKNTRTDCKRKKGRLTLVECKKKRKLRLVNVNDIALELCGQVKKYSFSVYEQGGLYYMT